jgi:hypothetical protein
VGCVPDRLLIDLTADGWVSVALRLEGESSEGSSSEPVKLALPLDGDALEDLRWYLEDYLRAPFAVYESRGPAAAASLPAWGEAMFKAVFGPGTAQHSYERVRPLLGGLRVVFRSASAELLALPWELIKDPGHALPLAIDVAGVDRSLPTAELGTPFEVAGGRLRVLMVISRPAGPADVGYRMIARPLLERLAVVRGAVDLVVLRPPTLEALARKLTEGLLAGEPFQVVHFDGHGTLAGARRDVRTADKAHPGTTPEGVLVFQALDGSSDPVRVSRLAQVLAAARVPVVVVNACQSGAVSKELEATVATRLLREGTASVVAMAYRVYAVAAAEFMTAFYERLFAGDTVSAAVTAGRQRLFRHDGRPSPKGYMPLADWVVPVHYMRREVRFPELATARPEGESSLDEALDQLRDPCPEDSGGALASVGTFTGRDGLFYELETAARLQRVVVLFGPAGSGKTELAKAFGRWWQDTNGVERPEWVFWHSFDPEMASFGLDGVLTEIGLSVFGPSFVHLEMAERASVVEGFLQDHRALLIWDNFESVRSVPDPTIAAPPLDDPGCQQLRDFLRQRAAGGSSVVLVTSRSDEAWLDDSGTGVIQHHQHPPPSQDLPQQPGPLLHLRRHLLSRDTETAQEHLQYLTRLDRVLTVGVAAQVRVQVPVRELVLQQVGGVHGQRGLADPGGPADRRHHHPAATSQPRQPGQLTVPASKGGHVPRQQTRQPRFRLARRGDVDGQVAARNVSIAPRRSFLSGLWLIGHRQSRVPLPLVDRHVMSGLVHVPARPRLLHWPPPRPIRPAVGAPGGPPRGHRKQHGQHRTRDPQRHALIQPDQAFADPPGQREPGR